MSATKYLNSVQGILEKIKTKEMKKNPGRREDHGRVHLE